MLTQARLKELLSYDPITGIFIREQSRRKVRKGSVAGTRRHDGYFTIFMDGHRYLCHRLAWLYMTGEWPLHFIDHIDGNPSNNSFSNLRDVEHTINTQNIRRARSFNSSGLLGANRFRGGFLSRIIVHKKVIHLGWFNTAEEAHEAYLIAKRELHEGCMI